MQQDDPLIEAATELIRWENSRLSSWPGQRSSTVSLRNSADSPPHQARAESGPKIVAQQPRKPTPKSTQPVGDNEPKRVAVPEDRMPAVQGRLQKLKVLEEQVRHCHACELHKQRTQTVFARGHADHATVVFVGEGPGFHEDQQGVPFVGPAGKMLDRMIQAMQLQQHFYICNVVKCRPPQNRTPRPEEMLACNDFLTQQLQLASPKIIVALGRCAAEGLGCIGPESKGWRGRWFSYSGTPVMCTYHPAYLLRNPEHKRVVWKDLQTVMQRLGTA